MAVLPEYVLSPKRGNYFYDHRDKFYRHKDDPTLTAIFSVPLWTKTFYLRGEITYFKKGEFHNPNPDTPARRTWHENGRLKREEWIVEGRHNNPDSFTPAFREWDEDGTLVGHG